jgi:nitroimidazol reductase NimA-like FMN-containing flavoprotein (pyridoxamine 5'-phosphate oxidase superfamily)
VEELARDRNGLEILERADCLLLLATVPVGRVAVTVDALPVILPVNFSVSTSGQIVFATRYGQKLRGAMDNAVIAFEADSFDPDTKVGWSVLVQDRAQVITRENAPQYEHLEFDRWAGEDASCYVVIGTALMSGRRISAPA